LIDYLSEVALQDIAVVDDWQAAPLGALVQMSVGPTKVVGMRTDSPAANGTVAAILVVSGEHAGELVESSHLQGPALLVSNVIEIVALDPVPFTLFPPIRKGILIKSRGAQPAYYVRSEVKPGLVGYVGLVGHVCVSDGGNPLHTRGKCVPNINPGDYVGVAEKVGVRLIGAQDD
jgi:hypothetical protein